MRVRLPHVLSWLESEKPDILALQETKITNEEFPLAILTASGYDVIFSGEKAYNGVAVLSREKTTDIITDFPSIEDPQRRVLGLTVGDTRILNLYIPNGQAVGSEKYQYKLNWLQHLTQFLQAELIKHEKYIILGDFNVARTLML